VRENFQKEIVMSVELEIQDGVPWYISPDIWTVPGDDPEGPPGIPIPGTNTYVWTRVRNNGTTRVENATLRFYWGIPGVGLNRNTANHIGDAFVSLDPQEMREVLCLTPWGTVFVNGGHECVLAEAFHPSDDPLPVSPAFSVATDRHVAQHNLTIIKTSQRQFVAHFEVVNTSRKNRAFTIAAEPGSLSELLRTASPSVKSAVGDARDGKVTNFSLSKKQCPDDDAPRTQETKIDGLEVGPGGRTGLTLIGEIEGGSGVVHVRQLSEDQGDMGGLAVLILNQ
jgi:hypothetical protein